jgi:hypothetical protein
MVTTRYSEPRFDHLRHLTDQHGLFEHADRTTPRVEHGYCTDDNARLVVVCVRETAEPVNDLLHMAVDFLVRSVSLAAPTEGKVHNRMSTIGRWTDNPSNEDCWGRAVWGLGYGSTLDGWLGRRARDAFAAAVRVRSPWSRSMAFAAVGAAEMAAHSGEVQQSRALLTEAVKVIGLLPPDADRRWMWPEPSLRYANAVLPEALIAAGATLGRNEVLDAGLRMLAWLVGIQTRDGHLSLVGADGRTRANYMTACESDQQPIEAAAIADACHRAWLITGDREWAHWVELAANWFHGGNDPGLLMCDPTTGAGFDGLHADRVNENCGAESTLAYVSTMQRSRSVTATVR